MNETNFIDGLRNHYLDSIGKCKCSCLKSIISTTELQYILDIITIFKFECEPCNDLSGDMLWLNIYLK